MDKKEIQSEKFKDLLSGTKMKASENLKFRIMQQIETEKALIPKKATDNGFISQSMFSIFGIMYAIIAVAGLIIYYMYGEKALLTNTFYLPVIVIASICSMFWMISIFDERRRSKHKK